MCQRLKRETINFDKRMARESSTATDTNDEGRLDLRAALLEVLSGEELGARVRRRRGERQLLLQGIGLAKRHEHLPRRTWYSPFQDD